MLLQGLKRFSCSNCFSFLRRRLPFLAYLCKVAFDIPEAYLEPNLEEYLFFAKILQGFQAITIFAKSSTDLPVRQI